MSDLEKAFVLNRQTRNKAKQQETRTTRVVDKTKTNPFLKAVPFYFFRLHVDSYNIYFSLLFQTNALNANLI